MKYQGRTQKWLAKRLEKSENTISSWCGNITQPTVDDLFRIGKALNISPKELLTDTKEEL